ncbi:hypothetical protein BT69DRAFT_1339229 [Atractiella rhizophila]|nr:hypothetical protein BT69DRAFT_1339229 [Atractiella rhizophila]
MNGTLQSGMFQENGASFVQVEINPLQASIFPQGSIHFQQNMECDPVVFVAAFGSADPGGLQFANRFFENLPADIVAATLGGLGLEEVAALADKVPANVAKGVASCLERCGLSEPGGYSWGRNSGLSNSTVKSSAALSINDAFSRAVSGSDSEASAVDEPFKKLAIGLLAGNFAFVLLVLVFVIYSHRRMLLRTSTALAAKGYPSGTKERVPLENPPMPYEEYEKSPSSFDDQTLHVRE